MYACGMCVCFLPKQHTRIVLMFMIPPLFHTVMSPISGYVIEAWFCQWYYYCGLVLHTV